MEIRICRVGVERGWADYWALRRLLLDGGDCKGAGLVDVVVGDEREACGDFCV